MPSPDLSVPLGPEFRSGPPLVPSTDPPEVPDRLGADLRGATWQQVWVKDGTEVWRVTADVVSYLKIGRGGSGTDVVAEKDRLVWLDGRQATPHALAFHEEGGTSWLLTSQVPGVPAHDPLHRMGSVEPWVRALGRSLRRFHDELAIDSCDFDARLDVLVPAAERRVAAGGVDTSILSATYRRHTAEQLLENLFATRPAEPDEDLVVAHGDPSLPNLLIGAGGDEVTGVVDVGRLGVSDRYRDLAILVRSLGQNIGPELAYVVLDAYGISNPDLSRLEFYVLLDEMW